MIMLHYPCRSQCINGFVVHIDAHVKFLDLETVHVQDSHTSWVAAYTRQTNSLAQLGRCMVILRASVCQDYCYIVVRQTAKKYLVAFSLPRTQYANDILKQAARQLSPTTSCITRRLRNSHLFHFPKPPRCKSKKTPYSIQQMPNHSLERMQAGNKLKSVPFQRRHARQVKSEKNTNAMRRPSFPGPFTPAAPARQSDRGARERKMQSN
jgi:hypothetical protein